MAKKDFDSYFFDICNQYHELNEELKDLEKACVDNVVDPAILENMKTMIEPLMTNWKTLSYIKFLLDMPVKSNKKEKYKKQQQALLAQSVGRQQNDLHKENLEVLDSVNSLTKQIRS